LTFKELLARVLSEVERRIQNGQLTERGLARLAELSQPHVHHILNGKRTITPQVADRFLRVLGMEAGQLLGNTPPPAQSVTAGCETERCVLLPLMEGLVGPGYPIPQFRQGGLYFPFPASCLDIVPPLPDSPPPTWRHMVVRVGHDALLEGLAEENDLLVIAIPRQSGQWERYPSLTAAPSLWTLDGSWIFRRGASQFPEQRQGFAKDDLEKAREDMLQTAGAPVALVLWLVRRLLATTIAWDGLIPNPESKPNKR